ncbi:hypothetical protein M9458_052310 [Cirrhinus mrigala]|uniref:Uncharacterized protein n=1 Tax=Cirrhinus mrigala TaxID=683832 RepID=A0ABD0MTW4_CIRMR
MCLGEKHARDVLEGAVYVHCELLPMKKLRSRLSLFSRKEGQPSAPCGSGPAAAEARRKLSLWGSQVDLANKLDKGLSLFHSSVRDESELLEDDDDVISLTSSDPAASALLGSTQEEQELLDKEMQSESSQTSCPAFRHTSYANIEGMRENGYERMPPIEETLASYLSLGEASSLNAPSLPSERLQRTSSLNGRAYAAAGQAVAFLHTMAVLQAYQADLLKDLDKGQGLSPDEVAELRCTTDLALRATKQAATAMGRSMAAMVVMERDLWVNLADLGKKEKGFLLNVLVSPSELFGTSIETVIEKFREAKARSAFKIFIPRRTRTEPEHRKGPGPSQSVERRQAQKASVAGRMPPCGRDSWLLLISPSWIGFGRFALCSAAEPLGRLSEVLFTRCPWRSLAGYIALLSCLALRGFLLPSYSPKPHTLRRFCGNLFFSAGSEEQQPARHNWAHSVRAHLRVGQNRALAFF